jgi:hypothetical protein
MAVILHDLLLFSCLAAFVTGIITFMMVPPQRQLPHMQ